MTAEIGWRSAPMGRAVLVVLEAAPRPLQSVLTEDELDRLRPVLDATVEAARAGEFSRIRLRDAARDAIGRDPFSQVEPEKDDDGGWWWPALLIVGGLMGVLSPDRPMWLRVIGGLVLAAGLDEVFQQLRRLRRRRAAR
ncbi:hypothetical protein Ait01nite_044570 [Actinoplanes italicus]|uniref:Uncharacterized protein n=1 Tax=Actinoplanes italicus TaxID=113567 RepID=A0A2T0KCG9_9ACTN|nr:hypothetical protein [Actinoplanes italicus]PRX20938.1 hypothetical protein CLV67_107215 [Actinoplanes italicus]GIE31412.1 hypothetical protein Ait01nite_044570 [Actinoplanes italicus]